MDRSVKNAPYSSLATRIRWTAWDGDGEVTVGVGSADPLGIEEAHGDGKMHADEVSTDLHLVGRLIAAQFPRWADLPLAPVRSAGTDNAIYRLGEDMAVRLPRIPGAVPQVDTEHRCLPRLAPLLPLDIPRSARPRRARGGLSLSLVRPPVARRIGRDDRAQHRRPPTPKVSGETNSPLPATERAVDYAHSRPDSQWCK